MPLDEKLKINEKSQHNKHFLHPVPEWLGLLVVCQPMTKMVKHYWSIAIIRRHKNRKQRSWTGTPFGHKVWRQRGSKGCGEEKKNTDTAFCFASNYGFIPLSQWERCRKHLMPALLFPQWPVAGSGAETRGLVDERKWKDEGWSRLELLLPVCV